MIGKLVPNDVENKTFYVKLVNSVTDWRTTCVTKRVVIGNKHNKLPLSQLTREPRH